MTAPSTNVKYFHSGMAGAPTLNGVAGTMIAVLDACLITGFGTVTADSVTVTGGVATLNRAAGIGAFETDAVILISGATPTQLNGEKKILSTSATSLTFDATGVTAGTATGTITAKLAPLGWEKPFSGTNLAAYRSADITSSRMFLRVDDTAAQNARVLGYENLTDINTGTGKFPTEAQFVGGLYWAKAHTTAGVARGWTIIGDANCFYIHIHTAVINPGIAGSVQMFGDFIKYRSADSYNAVLLGNIIDASNLTSSVGAAALEWSQGNSGAAFFPRSYSGIGGSTLGIHVMESYVTSGGSGNVAFIPFPNYTDNGIYLSRKYITENASPRGLLKGVLHNPQSIAGAFTHLFKLDGQGPFAGKRLLAIRCGSPAGQAYFGTLFFDITGSWV